MNAKWQIRKAFQLIMTSLHSGLLYDTAIARHAGRCWWVLHPNASTVVLNLWVTTPLGGHLRPSGNKDIYIAVHNSGTL